MTEGQASRATDHVKDLEELLRLVCSSLPPDEIAERLGVDGGESPGGRHPHIEPTAFAAFRAIDFRPWTREGFGVVEIELSDPDAWSAADLEPLVGPLEPVPVPDGPDDELQGIWESDALPAWAAVYVRLGAPRAGGDARVESLTVRTEPPE